VAKAETDDYPVVGMLSCSCFFSVVHTQISFLWSLPFGTGPEGKNSQVLLRADLVPRTYGLLGIRCVLTLERCSWGADEDEPPAWEGLPHLMFLLTLLSNAQNLQRVFTQRLQRPL
jgi:hypothetical protein